MMKIKLKRVICIILSIAVTFSLLSESLCASANAAMSVYSVQWYNPQKITRAVRKTTSLQLLASIDADSNGLYFELTFPEEGGVRFSTNKQGFFSPNALKKITYTELSSNKYLLQPENSTLNVVFDYSSTPWSITYSDTHNGKSFTVYSSQMYFGYDENNEMQKVKLEGRLTANEVIYGLGERYNGFNQVGSTVWLWNTDTGYHTWESGEKVNSYANVPILHSSQGYTLFFNSSYGGYADIGDSDPEVYSFDLNGTDFDFYMYLGTPLENIEAYTALTGRPVKSPEWAFSYWAGGTNGYWNNGEFSTDIAHLKDVIEGYNEMGTLPSAIFGEGTLTRNTSGYLIAKPYGIKLLGWCNPTIDFHHTYSFTRSKMQSLLPDVAAEDIPMARLTSDPTADNDYSYVDFSNPNAVALMKAAGYDVAIKRGLKGVMVDFGEYVDEWVTFYNDMKGDEMHNFYAYYYNKTMSEVFASNLDDDYILFARAGCAGSQGFAAMFGGDVNSSFDGLKASVSAGLSISSGFSNWGSDIGGHYSQYAVSDELYQRWLMFSLFSPLMRLHGGVDKNPWSFGDEAQETFKTAYALRESMIDLIYSANLTANKTGVPMMQAMAVAFPEEAWLAAEEEQYLFCNELLVCPVTDAGATTCTVSLPQGRWTSLWDGSLLGGGTYTVSAPVNQIPVYIREGAVLPMTLSEDYSIFEQPTTEGTDGLVITAPAERRNVSYETADGESATFTTVRNGDIYSVATLDGCTRTSLILAGIYADSIIVDGAALTKLSQMPISQTGYYVDEAGGRTVVNLGASWKSLKFTDSRALSEGMQFYSYGNDFSARDLETDLADFTVYHSAADSYIFKEVEPSDYLTTVDGTLTRITDDNGYSDRDMDRNIVSAVLTTEQFNDFVLDATIKGTAGGASSLGFVIGQTTPGAHYMSSTEGGYAVFFKRYGTVMNVGVAYNGKSLSADGSSSGFRRDTFVGSLDNFQERFGFSTGDPMNVRLVVRDKKLSAYIYSEVTDGYIALCEDVSLNNYNGGYIALAQSTAQVTEGAPADQYYDAVKIVRPDMPVEISEVYGSSVTVKPYIGYEYSIDGVNFSADNVFSGLLHNTQYLFYQRLASGSITVSQPITVKFLSGDFNGDNMYLADDLVKMRRILIGTAEDEQELADVNEDNIVDIRDLVRLKLLC